MKKITIDTLDITNEIVVGHLNSKSTLWLDKQVVTVEALFAVAKHIKAFGEPVILTNKNSGEEYTLTLTEGEK